MRPCDRSFRTRAKLALSTPHVNRWGEGELQRDPYATSAATYRSPHRLKQQSDVQSQLAHADLAVIFVVLGCCFKKQRNV